MTSLSPSLERYISLQPTIDDQYNAWLALEDAVDIAPLELDARDLCGCGIDRDHLRAIRAVGGRMDAKARACWMGRCAGALAAV